MVNSPQLASASHSGLYFVRYQENFVFVAELAQTRPEIIWWNNCSRFTLYWLHDDSSDIVANLACDLQLLLNSVGVTIRYVVNVIMQWHDRTAKNSLSGKSKRSRGFPMEAAYCSDKAALTCIEFRQLHSSLDGFGSTCHKEAILDIAGCNFC